MNVKSLYRYFCILTLCALPFFAMTQEWSGKALESYRKGAYKECIQFIDQALIENKESSSNFLLLQADAYLKLVEPGNYRKAYRAYFNRIQQLSEKDSLVYLMHEAHYYHYQLRADSSVVIADHSWDIYNELKQSLPDSLKAKYLAVYGNCIRNKRGQEKQSGRHIDRRRLSLEALNEALLYAPERQKHRVYRVLGTTYNDLVAMYYHSNAISRSEVQSLLEVTIETYQKALDHRAKYAPEDKLFKSQVYSLMGLTFQYVDEFDRARVCYEKAVDNAQSMGELVDRKAYYTAVSWKGWNEFEAFRKSNDVEFLERAFETYKRGVDAYLTYYQKHAKPNEGLHDGYRFSMLHKLPVALAHLYQIAGNEKYIDLALYYADLDNYLTYHERRSTQDSVKISKVQEVLHEREAAIIYLSSINPNETVALLIKKDTAFFVPINESRYVVSPETKELLTGKGDINEFIGRSRNLYKVFFEPLESQLKEDTNLIIIPSSNMTGLNFEVLLSDHSEGKYLWKELPYLFKRYNISYALSPSILIDNYAGSTMGNPGIQILQGDFSSQANLIFSKRLSGELHKRYSAKLMNDMDKKSMIQTFNKSGINMIIGHGSGSYFNSINTVAISDHLSLIASDFYGYQINSNLFVTTACNTNTSEAYFSEGKSGGFSKALHYSGVKAVLSTRWSVDDKASYKILRRFFDYISKEESKSKSLWKSKQEYWKEEKSDELFRPYYWSGFQLTGNTTSITLKAKEEQSLTAIILTVLISALSFLVVYKLWSTYRKLFQ